jgi:NAD(P)-dependent dehydrogenase (short-subunit alcohol dehydrogenase family)
MQVEGRTFLVTGGGSGLGAATARLLVESGANVVVADLGRREEIGRFVETDVRDETSVQGAVDTAVEEHGGLHGVVNCAGIGAAVLVVDKQGEPYPLDVFRKVIDVNLVGTFNVVRLAAVAMLANEPGEDGERGVIVNTASTAAWEGQIGQAAYTASKGGVASLTIQLARELGRQGIRVMAIAPGPQDTPMLGLLREDIRAALEAQIPFPSRLGRPEEFAALVRHIVENPYLNGEVIRLDGALRAAPR